MRVSPFSLGMSILLLLLSFGIAGCSENKKNNSSQSPSITPQTVKVDAAAPLSKKDYSLKGIDLGGSLQSLIAKLGEPKTKKQKQEGLSYDYGDIEFIMNSQNIIINILTDHPAVSTWRSVHVGSKIADVKAAYGETFTRTEISGLELYEFTFLEDGNNPYVLRFAVKAGTDSVAYIGCRLPSEIERILAAAGKKYIHQDIFSASSPQVASNLILQLLAAQDIYLEKILLPKYSDTMQKKLYGELGGKVIVDYDNIKDPEVKQLLLETRENGCKLESGEGMYFPVIDYEQLKKYSSYGTEDMKDYITIMAEESNQKAWEDGGLIIPLNKVLERALVQEKFLRKYGKSNSPIVCNVKKIFKNYVFAIFYGDNHAPRFDYKTKTVKLDDQRFFDSITTSTPNGSNSHLLQGIIEFNVMLKKNNYQLTDEMKKYRERIEAIL